MIPYGVKVIMTPSSGKQGSPLELAASVTPTASAWAHKPADDDGREAILYAFWRRGGRREARSSSPTSTG
jgi:hypothetical protein